MNTSQFDVSILIISWNTSDMLRDVLTSVYDTVGDLSAEVIVVDNASSDGSPDMVAAEFPQAVLVRNSDNTGFAAANNQAMEIAKGRQFLLLNSDTLVHGDVLQASVAYLDATPQAGAMGCRVLNTDGTVQLTCSAWPSVTNLVLLTSGLWKLRFPRFLGRYQMTHWLRDSERAVDIISGCYLLVRREVVDEVGLLDESFFFYGEETDWCRRIRDKGHKLMFAPVGEITHHGGGSVKKLNHKRDIMLTEALVRLHLKHGGRLAAGAAWCVLNGFNLSRAVFWSGAALLRRSDHARERATHFRKVFANAFATWPAQPAQETA
jgi:GT2 family glycosyltransferase